MTAGLKFDLTGGGGRRLRAMRVYSVYPTARQAMSGVMIRGRGKLFSNSRDLEGAQLAVVHIQCPQVRKSDASE